MVMLAESLEDTKSCEGFQHPVQTLEVFKGWKLSFQEWV